jgi:plastocyanin
MKRLIAVLVAVAAVAAALAVPALGATTHTVKVGPHRTFGPKTLTIRSGDTVRFRWTGSLAHNVVITKGPHQRAGSRVRTISRVRFSGVVRKKFRTRGTYTIVCQIHPGMTLKLRVT